MKMYDIFRKDLHLPEDRAQDLVLTINEVVKDQTAHNLEHGFETIRNDIQSLKNDNQSLKSDNQSVKNDILSLKNDIQSLKEYNDLKFFTKEEGARLELQVEGVKSEIVRWMFLFWIGQMAATFAFIFVFLKK